VEAELTPFIEDTASAMAGADLVICRAGASTVTEIAAVGAAALFVPFPAAVDDHQTHNARFLAGQGAAWLMPQSTLTAQSLAQWLQTCDRPTLSRHAQAAKAMQNLQATAAMVAACQEVLA
jgi:UDP-N-acetylglucosamine--N-acetylmuramyl-(pentapeptide) pyrophosphoryl-undecaprenol N-acetylglucosamine transferase